MPATAKQSASKGSRVRTRPKHAPLRPNGALTVAGKEVVLVDELQAVDGLNVAAILPANPAYWTEWQVAKQARMYGRWSCTRLAVTYHPTVSEDTPGQAFISVLEGGPYGRGLKNQLLVGNRSKFFRLTSRWNSNVRRDSNFYRINGDPNPSSVGWLVILGFTGAVVGGYFEVDYQYEFQNPSSVVSTFVMGITSGYEPDQMAGLHQGLWTLENVPGLGLCSYLDVDSGVVRKSGTEVHPAGLVLALANGPESLDATDSSNIQLDVQLWNRLEFSTDLEEWTTVKPWKSGSASPSYTGYPRTVSVIVGSEVYGPEKHTVDPNHDYVTFVQWWWGLRVFEFDWERMSPGHYFYIPTVVANPDDPEDVPKVYKVVYLRLRSNMGRYSQVYVSDPNIQVTWPMNSVPTSLSGLFVPPTLSLLRHYPSGVFEGGEEPDDGLPSELPDADEEPSFNLELLSLKVPSERYNFAGMAELASSSVLEPGHTYFYQPKVPLLYVPTIVFHVEERKLVPVYEHYVVGETSDAAADGVYMCQNVRKESAKLQGYCVEAPPDMDSSEGRYTEERVYTHQVSVPEKGKYCAFPYLGPRADPYPTVLSGPDVEWLDEVTECSLTTQPEWWRKAATSDGVVLSAFAPWWIVPPGAPSGVTEQRRYFLPTDRLVLPLKDFGFDVVLEVDAPKGDRTVTINTINPHIAVGAMYVHNVEAGSD